MDAAAWIGPLYAHLDQICSIMSQSAVGGIT